MTDAITTTKPEAVAVWGAPELTRERVELIKKSCIPQGCSDTEFQLFIEWCRRTGLDPLLKQAYLIERSQNVGGNWVKRLEPQAASAGLAARVDSMPDFEGMLGAAVYEGDVIEFDHSTGAVAKHVSDPTKRGKLLGAWAHLKRCGRITRPTYLSLESRIQKTRDGKPTRFWETMPATMILKCAEAEQYRVAYANMFGGVYVSEEMPPPDAVLEREVNPPAPQVTATKTRTETVADKVRAKVGASPTPPPAPALPPPPVEEFPTVTFGPSKGKPIAGLSAEELSDSIALGEGKLAKEPSAAWAAAVTANLDALKVEQEKRMAEIGGDAQ